MICKDCQYDLRLLTGRKCPECGRPFDPDDPETFDAKPPGLGAYGKVLTNIGIYLAAGSVIALVVLWLVAWQDDKLVYVQRWWRTPPQFRGNHGPWRRWGFAGSACTLSSIFMFAALIFAWFGAASKCSVKSVIIAILIPVLMYTLMYYHILLID